MEMINLTIDELEIKVPEGTTIMQAADKVGSHVPRLCYHPHLSTDGACRICIVEVEGYKNFVASCHTKVEEGMKVRTNSPEIRQTRRDLVELMLDNHPRACLTCERDGNCELQNLAYRLGVRERLFAGERKRHQIETDNAAIVRDAEKCILCRRCVRVCAEVQGVFNLSQMHRGFATVVTPAFEAKMDESVCIMCGQCINVCPTAAFSEKSHTERVFDALSNPQKHVVVQVAPAIRVAIAEGWNTLGIDATGKTVEALRRLGFDAIFDTNFGADLTIMEESNELIKRIEKNENLPLLTSCSPGWINFMEHFYPEMIPYASTCKSPMQMTSTLIKTYYAEKTGIDPKNIYSVAIMPCVAKKYEASREEHFAPEGYPYTDAVLTTRELIWMIKAMGVDFMNLPDGEFDDPLGESTGAAAIFGTTGGVMEAALRTSIVKLTGKKPENLDFYDVRATTDGLKEATIMINGMELNVAVANGLANARTILDKVQSGEKQYHLIELMACPGGCISGGGQPHQPAEEYVYPLDSNIIEKRKSAIYSIDTNKTIRISSDNPSIKKIYKEFLKKPGSETAHHLLHTTYSEKYPRGVK